MEVNFLELECADISKKEAVEYKRVNDFKFFNTTYNFLVSHKGLRPGRMHLLIGPPGSGKSSLLISLITQAAHASRVVVWLSEETRADFLMRLCDHEISTEVRKNILILSEMDKNFPVKVLSNISKYRNLLEETLKNYNPHVVIFDNITTSFVYQRMNPADQGEHCNWLKRICIDKFALVICAHTKKGVHDNFKLLELDDIRGSSNIVNLAEYAYTYQRISTEGKYFPILRLLKARYHQPGLYFLLKYDPKTRAYISDQEIKFDDVKKIFSMRDKI